MFWSSVKNHDGFITKPIVWTRWLQTAYAFNNKCNGMSFAQVVVKKSKWVKIKVILLINPVWVATIRLLKSDVL